MKYPDRWFLDGAKDLLIFVLLLAVMYFVMDKAMQPALVYEAQQKQIAAENRVTALMTQTARPTPTPCIRTTGTPYCY